MTLTRLLAAGRSIVGIRKGPGPYRMSPEHQLPNFGPLPKPPLQTTSVPVKQPLATAVTGEQVRPLVGPTPLPRTAVHSELELPRPVAGAPSPKADSRRFFWHLATQLARWARHRGQRPTPSAGGGHVQPELPLASLKVVRNDLKDSDGESKTARRPNTLNSGATRLTNSPRTPSGIVWNRLSAPLLRQAAQEFDSAQEQRARFLSHASNGRAGGHGH